MNRKILLLFLLLLVAFPYSVLKVDASDHTFYEGRNSFINIRNTNGKLYAYIVLLFNENPHFVNMIQEDSIPMKAMQVDGYHKKAYRQYLKSIRSYHLLKEASMILSVYEHPEKFSKKAIGSLEDSLSKRNIIVKFSNPEGKKNKISLEYCILGRKSPISEQHPFFLINEKIYNITPLIYYDEFSTSNSTFYFDMIYINPEEVQNDYIIVKKILNNGSVNNLFYVGARINDDITYCIKKAFPVRQKIKSDILGLFEVHEITHKVLNNKYNLYDQVIGEELALSSTIYANPYLGLSVMYCYLDYNSVNPHRIGALNYIRYISSASGNPDLYEHPSQIKYLSKEEIRKLTKQHFYSLIKALQ